MKTTDKQALEAIAIRLKGIAMEDLTIAERDIVDILIVNGYFAPRKSYSLYDKRKLTETQFANSQAIIDRE